MKNCIMILLILFIVSSCIPINNKGFNSYKKNTNKHGYWIYINDTVNTYEIVEYKYGKKNGSYYKFNKKNKILVEGKL